MRILVDREIARADSAFRAFGDVVLFEGRNLSRADLDGADALIVRSVTRIDDKLLASHAPPFIATTTAGVDHVDQAALAAREVRFAAAPGCNALAVAEHVVCCIYDHAAVTARDARDLTVGIVGFGHVGQELGRLLNAVGIAFKKHDPPLELRGGAKSDPLSACLACDVLTLHVPLHTGGDHPTHNLIDRDAIAALPAGALVINAARGGVLDEAALAERLASGDLAAALDCWDGEPRINPAMLGAVRFATPHIAGHTREARLRATSMVCAALEEFVQDDRETPAAAAAGPVIAVEPERGAAVTDVLHAVHDLRLHTRRMRDGAHEVDDYDAAYFDRLRRDFGLRREFTAYGVASAGLAPDTVSQLAALGFSVR